MLELVNKLKQIINQLQLANQNEEIRKRILLIKKNISVIEKLMEE